MKYLGSITNDTDITTKKYVDDGLDSKQDSLVSGTNIKTINNQSVLGSGNLTVGGGGIQNFVDGSATGSVRGVGTSAESGSYTIGAYALAEGSDTKAIGDSSHAEGEATTASEDVSHAEGFGTTASGAGSHAEGTYTTASGDSSHAEGANTTASGGTSHAGGYYTIAGYDNQTVIGKYNNNKSTSLFEIGNGNSSARSNAFEVDTSGNINIAASAKYKINGTALSASDVGALASADLYTRSSSGGLDWGDGSTGNKVIAKSALAFWNGSYDGATSNLQRLNSTVYIGGTQMKDFIKEQGTSSSWYYRKWNSGKIEAWRTYNAGSQTPAQWVTGWYYKDIDIAIPSGIFSAAPNHTVATNNGSDYQYTVHVARATSATNIRVRCVKPNSGAATPVLALYVSNMV